MFIGFVMTIDSTAIATGISIARIVITTVIVLAMLTVLQMCHDLVGSRTFYSHHCYCYCYCYAITTVIVKVCHDLVGSRTFYSHHALFDEINARDHGNDSPPFK